MNTGNNAARLCAITLLSALCALPTANAADKMDSPNGRRGYTTVSMSGQSSDTFFPSANQPAATASDGEIEPLAQSAMPTETVALSRAPLAQSPAAHYEIEPLDTAPYQSVIDEAYKLLTEARNTSQKISEPGNAAYVAATVKLQELLDTDPLNIEGLALLAQVYRLRGSGIYAAKYFAKSCSAIEESQFGSTWQGKLTLALLYTAGDVRFWPDSADYKAKGQLLAKEALQEIDAINDGGGGAADSTAVARLLRAKAMAEIVAGQPEEAWELLATALKLPLPSAEADIARKYYDLLQMAVGGEWIWPMKPQSAILEYLLCYCYDTSRFIVVRSAQSSDPSP